ncbi:MAG: hypothetical protein ABFS38_14535 [Bacteroidota bacterium]
MRPGNIVMFHIGRCGSTVLSSLLSQHKSIYWASEFYSSVFRKWEQANKGNEIAGEMPADAIDLLKKNMQNAFHRYYGFEIKPFHLQLIGYTPELYLEKLEELGYTYFIHLDRKNRLRKIVSSLIAHEDQLKYHQKGKAKLKQVHIEVNNVVIDFDSKPLLAFLSDFDSQVSSVESLLKSKNPLNLTYEDDIQEDPRIGYRKICDFIGMKSKDVTVKLSRTNPFQVRDMIENIEEVEAVLKGTKYEWMLND